MSATWRFVAFPLILPWRPEFWSLPLFFPDLEVGVLWQWPSGVPYRGRPLPAKAVGGRDFRDYAPGELKQWQAYKEYSDSREEVDDIVRALKGEPATSEAAEGPWQEEASNLAWQLEMMEADQEAHLAKVDRGEEWLAEVLAPETWEEPGIFAGMPGVKEMIDPETARLRYFLWRREMESVLGPKSAPLLLGRTSQSIFTSLRMEAGRAAAPPLVRFKVPGCRREEEYQAAMKVETASAWQEEFQQLLEACLAAADQGGEQAQPVHELSRWLGEELPRQWPEAPTWTWDLEIWGRDPEIEEGGETLLVWGGLGKEVVPG